MNKRAQLGSGLRIAIMIIIIVIFFAIVMTFFLKKINLGVPN